MQKDTKDNNINSSLLKDSVFKIGKVTSVEGRFIKVTVDKSKNLSHLLYKGELLKNISVGSYIKILKGFTKIIGKIEGEYITEDKYSSAILNKTKDRSEANKIYSMKNYGHEKEKISRVLNVSLLGYFGNKEFQRGIKELPLIDNECFLLEKEEFNKVHNFIKDGDESIEIGFLSFEKGQKIEIGIDSLFASHIGIFGNTGSGKSYTLAKIYRELFEKYKNEDKFKQNSHFLLIDFNGEYIGKNVIIEEKFKNRYELSTTSDTYKDKYPVTKDNIQDYLFWSIFLTATEKTQTPFLKRTLEKSDVDASQIKKVVTDIFTNEDRKIDKGVIFNFLEDIKFFLKVDINIGSLRDNLKYHSTNNTYYFLTDSNKSDTSDNRFYSNSNLIEFSNKVMSFLACKNNDFELENVDYLNKIYLKIIYHYYNEIVRGFANQEHLAPLIKRLDKRISDLEKVIEIKNENKSEKNFTIISLKDVNMDMKKILPLLICKQLYDNKKKNNEKEKSLNFIIDEAHNILSYSSERESEAWKDYRLETFEEIIKEGRKFGVFLTIASQRPADISNTIISQLHNYFLHRLINNKDILTVEKTISYLDKVSFDYLPIMPTGTCIFTGLTAQVPVVLDIGEIQPEFTPDNETIKLTKNWSE